MYSSFRKLFDSLILIKTVCLVLDSFCFDNAGYESPVVISIGPDPFLSVYYIPRPLQRSGFSIIKSVSKFSSLLSGNQSHQALPPVENGTLGWFINDEQREAISMEVSYGNQWIGIVDNNGRVITIDTLHGTVGRILKGFRDAQIAFVGNLLVVCSSFRGILVLCDPATETSYDAIAIGKNGRLKQVKAEHGTNAIFISQTGSCLRVEVTLRRSRVFAPAINQPPQNAERTIDFSTEEEVANYIQTISDSNEAGRVIDLLINEDALKLEHLETIFARVEHSPLPHDLGFIFKRSQSIIDRGDTKYSIFCELYKIYIRSEQKPPLPQFLRNPSEFISLFFGDEPSPDGVYRAYFLSRTKKDDFIAKYVEFCTHLSNDELSRMGSTVRSVFEDRQALSAARSHLKNYQGLLLDFLPV